MPREIAVALFRMKTGHDSLPEYLHRTGCLQTSKCLLYKEDAIVNKSYLSECKTLSEQKLTVLYWEATGKMICKSIYSWCYWTTTT